MPTAKPRITITLEPHTHEVLTRLSAAGGQSMSSIVADYVALAVPSLERLVVVLEQARQAPQEAQSGLAAALERAERQLLPALASALDQNDLFLSDLEASAGRKGPVPMSGSETVRRLVAEAKAERARRSTPVPVTRGSGGPARVRKGGRRGKV